MVPPARSRCPEEAQTPRLRGAHRPGVKPASGTPDAGGGRSPSRSSATLRGVAAPSPMARPSVSEAGDAPEQSSGVWMCRKPCDYVIIQSQMGGARFTSARGASPSRAAGPVSPDHRYRPGIANRVTSVRPVLLARIRLSGSASMQVCGKAFSLRRQAPRPGLRRTVGTTRLPGRSATLVGPHRTPGEIRSSAGPMIRVAHAAATDR